MTQPLPFDFTAAPERNSDYFYPLTLQLDPAEREHFVATALVPYLAKISGSGHGLSNVGNADDYFPKTIAQTNQYVAPLGLTVRRVTLFVSDQNQTSWVIHSDGVWYQQQPSILEARLSYYEISTAPGAIRWWDNNLPATLQVFPATDYTQQRVTCMADCAEAIRTDQIGWADIPAPAFATVTSSPSAILRTNRLHHVIQSSGVRVTVACQLVWPSGDPVGVWAHIQNNIDLLGI